jgi:ribitol-5-phosphate 2-dehydrogenase (NADP+) / D-ribitol-5-phosphate cytidylyltransferase
MNDTIATPQKNIVLILAGGSGSRLDSRLPKQFLQIAGKTVLHHTIEAFESHPLVHHILLVTNPQYLEKTREITRTGGYSKILDIVEGGTARQDSSRIGIEFAAQTAEYENVLIHDAARPLVSRKIIDDLFDALTRFSAVNVAIPATDTIIEIDENNLIKNVPDRSQLRCVQTPQGFKLRLIQKAHRLAPQKGITQATDDCSLILLLNLAPIYAVQGDQENIKITYPQDLQIAADILKLRR